MALHLISLAAGSAFVPAQPKLVTSSGLGPTIGAVSGSVLAASAATLFSEPSTTTSNIIFSEPVGVMVFACAVSGVFLHFSSRTYEAAGIDEACVVQEEPTCGPMSFDSVCASRCPDAFAARAPTNALPWCARRSVLFADCGHGVHRAAGRRRSADLEVRVGTPQTRHRPQPKESTLDGWRYVRQKAQHIYMNMKQLMAGTRTGVPTLGWPDANISCGVLTARGCMPGILALLESRSPWRDWLLRL